MRVIAHISDLHFGTVARFADEALLADLIDLKPSLIAISGDLTQRAMHQEFQHARAYLSRLPSPYLVVPGNHDIPLFDVTRRFLLPLHRYKFYISAHLSPLYADNEISVFGVNTARSLTFENGRISKKQLVMTEATLMGLPPSTMRVIVTHHPFVRHVTYRKIVGGAEEALKVFDRCGVDLVLSGHFHRAHAEDLRSTYASITRSMIHVQAGTAISTRTRAEPNSYNVITLEQDRIHIDVRKWFGEGFKTSHVVEFVRTHGEWKKNPKAAHATR